MITHTEKAIKRMEEHLSGWFKERGCDISYFRDLSPNEQEILHDRIYKRRGALKGIELERIARKLHLIGENARGEGSDPHQNRSKKELLELFQPSNEERLKKY